jgi:hypothetical protein
MNKQYIIVLTAVAALSSCRKDLLKTVPADRISTGIYWKTDGDATNAANAVYTYMDGTVLTFWDGFSDIGHFNTNGAVESAIAKGTADAQNSRFAEQYTTCYKGIHAANYYMENIGKVTVTNQALVNSRTGEVRALRAYYYLKLVGWFGAVPLVTSSITIDQGLQLTRTDISTVYDFISNELDTAATLLPLTQPDKGRITRGAALALKARAMLWAGRYEAAAAAAKAVMDLKVYSLYPRYQQLFSYAAENNSEVIMDKEFIKDTYSNNVFFNLAPFSLASSIAQVVPTRQLGDEYEMTNGRMITDPASGFDPYNPYVNRDPRMAYSIFRPGDVLPNGKTYNSVPGSGTPDAVGGGSLYATTTGYNVKKYVNPEDLATPSNCGINIILIRYAEVLLTYAEARIEANQIDQSVYDAIDSVRARGDVNMPPISTGLTRDELRKAVRHERTVELAFEGLHTFDIRRWRTAETVMPGAVQGITYVKNGSLVTVVNNSVVRSFRADRDYLWPIPQQERILNPKLTQNPNW